jgi:hypothetical protein
VWLNERVVDSDDLNVIVLDGIAEDNTTDTTEAVDSDLDWSHSAFAKSALKVLHPSQVHGIGNWIKVGGVAW